MRVFLAIELPDEVCGYLRQLQKNLVYGRFSLVKNFHVTLKFLDEISEAQRQQIKFKLSDLASEKFTARLSRIGFFPDDKYIKVVWVGAEPADKFRTLYSEVEERLKSMFKKDDFVAHITIARVKFIDDRDKFLNTLRGLSIEQLEFPVNGIKLKRSTLSPSGPVYDDLEEFSLQ